MDDLRAGNTYDKYTIIFCLNYASGWKIA